MGFFFSRHSWSQGVPVSQGFHIVGFEMIFFLLAATPDASHRPQDVLGRRFFFVWVSGSHLVVLVALGSVLLAELQSPSGMLGPTRVSYVQGECLAHCLCSSGCPCPSCLHLHWPQWTPATPRRRWHGSRTGHNQSINIGWPWTIQRLYLKNSYCFTIGCCMFSKWIIIK